MAHSLRTTPLPVTSVALPQTPTTSATSWDAIVAHLAIWSTGRGLTWCSPPNSDVCTRFPSIKVAASPTNSIFPWGYCSEHGSPRSLPDALVHLVGAVCLWACGSTKCRTQGQGAAHAKRAPGEWSFEGCGLAHASGDHSSTRATSADRTNPPVGAEG